MVLFTGIRYCAPSYARKIDSEADIRMNNNTIGLPFLPIMCYTPENNTWRWKNKKIGPLVPKRQKCLVCSVYICEDLYVSPIPLNYIKAYPIAIPDTYHLLNKTIELPISPLTAFSILNHLLNLTITSPKTRFQLIAPILQVALKLRSSKFLSICSHSVPFALRPVTCTVNYPIFIWIFWMQ